MNDLDGEVCQYRNFKSLVAGGVWYKISQLKLNHDGLNETKRIIFGSYEYLGADLSPVMCVEGTAFNSVPAISKYSAISYGVLIIKNTVEDFKSCNKAELITAEGKDFWNDIVTGKSITNPSLLSRFILITYADMKKYNYYYWFAFPVPNYPSVIMNSPPLNIAEVFKERQTKTLVESFYKLHFEQKSYFYLKQSGDDICCEPLSTVLSANPEENKIFAKSIKTFPAFGLMDPSGDEFPGWPLRSFIAMLTFKCPYIQGRCISFLCLRIKSNGDCRESKVFNIAIPDKMDGPWGEQWVGWERNDKGNFGPRLACMASSMDPLRLAESSVDLNLKLMKWRLMPNLDLGVIKDAKCLLFGAGTLGCAVARNLLSWGVRHITFIDNGKVSFSNPVRQSLYTHADCLEGGRHKALAAAENLKRIFPGVKSRGIILHIPMPGHPVGENLKTGVAANIDVLAKEISNHQILFLLLDSREARWLPTLLGTHFGKVVINAALGFDSYLVMRHGAYDTRSETDLLEACSLNDLKSHSIPGNQLGCYFCNDVTAPGNSQKDRTLDQQCTVTRPGVSSIAGALAAEMAISLIQHKHDMYAPAPYNISPDDLLKYEDNDSIFGMIPHSIRGFLSSYQQVLPTSGKFKQCIACSNIIVDLYRKEGSDFLFKVFTNDKHLEDVTGLTDLHAKADSTEMWAITDSEESTLSEDEEDEVDEVD